MHKHISLHTALLVTILSALNILVITSNLGPIGNVKAATLIDDTPVNKKVLLINFNPTIESQGNIKLNSLKNWYDPNSITQSLIQAFPQLTHGYLSYTITETIEVDGIFPKSDGFQYTDESYLSCLAQSSNCHNPDGINYNQLFTTYDICSKNVDEVWLWGGPYFGYQEFTINNSCGKSTFVMGFNYERGPAEAFHDFGHRMEFVGYNRIGTGGSSWQQNEINEWNKFSMINGHCGNIHYPPGTTVPTDEYNYSKSNLVTTDCDRYLNYPDAPSTPQEISCLSWSCTQEGFMRWWLNRIPSNSGHSSINGQYIYHNWWKYFANYDETAAGIPGAPTPTPTPTPIPGTYSNVSATFYNPTPATFNFTYSRPNTNFVIDVSTLPDMSYDVFLTFAQGNSSPITVTNPTKWDKYSCGRTLYWRVKTAADQSPIQQTTVDCSIPTPTNTPTPTPTNSPTPTLTPSPTPTPTSTPTPTPTPTPIKPNLISNPNFEIDSNSNNLPDNWTTNKNFTRSSLDKFSDTYSGRFFSTNNTGFSVNQTIQNLVGGTTYQFTGYLNIPPTSDAFTFTLRGVWMNRNGSTISNFTISSLSKPTPGWTPVSSSLSAPSQATRLRLIMELNSLKGPIYVDNFSLK